LALSRSLAPIPPSCLLVLIIVLGSIPSTGWVFEPPYLLLVLNGVFITLALCLVAFISAKGYVVGGSNILLLMGTGMLALGLTSLIAGLIRPLGANQNVTVYNIGAMFAGLLQAASALLTFSGTPSRSRTRGIVKLVSSYAGAVIFTILVSIATLLEAFPPFFVEGVGPTPLRQAVLGTSILLFAFSSILFARAHLKTKSNVLFWYCLALALMAVGLSGVFLQREVGGPIGWAGRVSQYFGGLYFIFAVRAAGQSSVIEERTRP
jgi:hypothetical protein